MNLPFPLAVWFDLNLFRSYRYATGVALQQYCWYMLPHKHIIIVTLCRCAVFLDVTACDQPGDGLVSPHWLEYGMELLLHFRHRLIFLGTLMTLTLHLALMPDLTGPLLFFDPTTRGYGRILCSTAETHSKKTPRVSSKESRHNYFFQTKKSSKYHR